MNRIINNGLGEDLRTLILVAGPDIVHHLIEAFDHMEGIDTDLGQRETLFGDRDKAVTHIAAEVFYLLPPLQRKLVEILVHVDVGGLVQDVDDRAGILVENVAVVCIAIPPGGNPKRRYCP